MDETTGAPAGRESGEPAHQQAVAADTEARAEDAWRKYIRHTVELCKSTCRTPGIDCPEARELKAAWNAAKRAA